MNEVFESGTPADSGDASGNTGNTIFMLSDGFIAFRGTDVIREEVRALEGGIAPDESAVALRAEVLREFIREHPELLEEANAQGRDKPLDK